MVAKELPSVTPWNTTKYKTEYAKKTGWWLTVAVRINTANRMNELAKTIFVIFCRFTGFMDGTDNPIAIGRIELDKITILVVVIFA